MAITSGLTLLQKLQKLFGARAVSDMMGQTTNVQTLAKGTNNPFANTFSSKYLAKNKDGVEEASKVIIENMQYAFGNKNARQMKNFENNVDTLYNIKFPQKNTGTKQAEILDLKTKKPVTEEGIASLKTDLGLPEDVSPNSPLGELLLEQKKLTKQFASPKISKGDIFMDMTKASAKPINIEREGQVRTASREFLNRELKLGKIKLKPEETKSILQPSGGGTDPIDILRTYYGEDVLDALDNLAPKFMQAEKYSDYLKIMDNNLDKSFFKPRKDPSIRQSYTDDEMRDIVNKKEDDLGDKLKNLPDDIDPDAMAQGGRAGYGIGNLVKEKIPPEYRLYAKSILPGGESGKVDESYFTEDFKKTLRTQALEKFKQTGELKGSVNQFDQVRGFHNRDEKLNKLVGMPSTYASLGAYSYEIDPKTLDVKIKDKYDWNPSYGKIDKNRVGFINNQAKEGRDVDLTMMKDFVKNAIKEGRLDKANALELIGNYFGGKESQGTGFDVDIDIPTQEATTATEGSFAQGGIAGQLHLNEGGRVGFANGGIDYDIDSLRDPFAAVPDYLQNLTDYDFNSSAYTGGNYNPFAQDFDKFLAAYNQATGGGGTTNVDPTTGKVNTSFGSFNPSGAYQNYVENVSRRSDYDGRGIGKFYDYDRLNLTPERSAEMKKEEAIMNALYGAAGRGDPRDRSEYQIDNSYDKYLSAYRDDFQKKRLQEQQTGDASIAEQIAAQDRAAATGNNSLSTAIQTAGKILDPGKTASTAGKGMTTLYSGTTAKDPFGGSKFFATDNLDTAKSYATDSKLRGSAFSGPVTGKVLQANVPTSQVDDLVKRGLTGTREVVLDPQASKALFEAGEGTLKGSSSLGTRAAVKAARAIPVAGTGLALADAASRLKQGDYVGAGLGAASALPVIGIPALGAQIAYDQRSKIAPYAKKFGNQLADKMTNLFQNRGVDPRMAATYEQNKQILADPRMGAAYGGRIGFKNGGMDRRAFLKLMGGLASLPVVGKFFKGAKVASKIPMLKNTTTTMPAWFPDLVDKFVAKGVGKKIDKDIMEYTTKELPGIKITKHDDGRIYVEGQNDYYKSYDIEYQPPGYEVTDYKTGKAVKTKGDFTASEEVPVNMDPDGNVDYDGEILESVDDILTSDARTMEEFATGSKIKNPKRGEQRVGQAEVRLENEADAYAERMAEEADEFAKGGLAGQLL